MKKDFIEDIFKQLVTAPDGQIDEGVRKMLIDNIDSPCDVKFETIRQISEFDGSRISGFMRQVCLVCNDINAKSDE